MRSTVGAFVGHVAVFATKWGYTGRALNGQRGLNLTETIIAVFLISLGVLTVAALVQAGMVANRKAERAFLAAFLAEKHLERVRAHALTTANFASLDRAAAPDSEYPDYTVQVDSELVPLFSPSTSLEARVPVADRRKLTQSYRKVRVRVSWAPTDGVELYTLVGAPADRELDTITLSAPGGLPDPVAQNATVPFEAVGRDASGQVIPDLFFDWTVNTKSSVGSFASVSRDGANATFQHWYRKDAFTGDDVHGPAGQTQVNVTGAYHSLTKKASAELLNLEGP